MPSRDLNFWLSVVTVKKNMVIGIMVVMVAIMTILILLFEILTCKEINLEKHAEVVPLK